MAVFLLSDKIAFPPPEYAEEGGLIAVGGDLTEDRLLLAYSVGIFPWYSEGLPILWWSPDPRLILIPEELRISRSLSQTIKKGIYEITMDRAFDEVIKGCARIHSRRDKGTWITDEMIRAYVKLHDSGFAHSVESWYRGELAGGLYGVAMGGAFFGESMFAKRSDASKVAFVKLVRQLVGWNFKMIDCQITSGHLLSFGAKEVPRTEFINMLRDALRKPDRRGRWTLSV